MSENTTIKNPFIGLGLSGLATPAPKVGLALADLLSTPPQRGLNISTLGYSLPRMWIGVRERFTQFNKNLVLTTLQKEDALKKYAGVIGCLNRNYYNSNSIVDNSFMIGSWAKGTVTRPPRDVDLYFVLPASVYYRYQSQLGNRQSALLQEVKKQLAITYPNTDMRGDGQVVMVRFGSYAVEVVPAFLLTNNRYWICDTHNDGSYKETDPWAEVNHIDIIDNSTNHNLRPLIRMLKIWQKFCSVPIKSFQLELLAADFLEKSPWRHYDYFWFDWIIRDFFAYLYHRANYFLLIPGTYETLYLGDEWQSRTKSAYNRAAKACQYEKDNLVITAGDEWQKVFGTQIPRSV